MYLLSLISSVGLIGATVFLLFFVLALVIHEWAHAYSANALGDDTPRLMGRLTLDPRAHIDPLGAFLFLFAGFGWGKPVPYNPLRLKRHVDELYIALAGPGINLIAAVILNLLAFGLAHLSTSQPVLNLTSFLAIGAQVNVLIAAFNLLPLPPLDGSSILAYFFPKYRSVQFSQVGIMIILLTVFVPIGGQSLLWIILNPIMSFFQVITLSGLVR